MDLQNASGGNNGADLGYYRRLDRDCRGAPAAHRASRRAIDARLGANDVILSVEVPASEGRLLSWIHANAEVLDEEIAETGAVTTRFRIDPATRGKLESELKRAGVASEFAAARPE